MLNTGSRLPYFTNSLVSWDQVGKYVSQKHFEFKLMVVNRLLTKKLYVKCSPNIWVHILEEIVYGLTTPPLFLTSTVCWLLLSRKSSLEEKKHSLFAVDGFLLNVKISPAYRKLALSISYVQILRVMQLVLKVTMGKGFFYPNLADSVILDMSSRKSLFGLQSENCQYFRLYFILFKYLHKGMFVFAINWDPS